MRYFIALVVASLAMAGGCGVVAEQAPRPGPGTGFYYDASGRLAAVQQGATTSVYRFDSAGNRAAVSRVRSSDFDPVSLRARSRLRPRLAGVSPTLVAQGSTVVIRGSAFDSDPMGDVVSFGGVLGRVLSANTHELHVQLPPVATPGPVTVSTAYGRSTSPDGLVVVPAEVDPADVHDVAATSIGKAATIDPGSTLLTFRGTAGATVELHPGTRCDADVGLAGPTGTIIEADAGDASWCDRPARLPMTGTYTATVTSSGAVRASIRPAHVAVTSRLPDKPAVAAVHRSLAAPATDGPPGFPVDLSSGLMDTAVTDLALGGSGAVDLARTFSVGDPDLPAAAPEEPVARHWSLAASIAIEPSMSYSFLDLVMPDGRRLPFRRVTEGAPEPAGAVFEPSGGVGSGPFAGSRVAYTSSGWELTTRAGTVLGFGHSGSPLRLNWVRDPTGHTSRFIRAPDREDGSPDGDLVGVVSESGQWARFEHDADGRISAATDQVGDRVTYHYGRPDRVFADVLTRVDYQRADGPRTSVGYRYQPLIGRLAAVTDGRRDRIRFEYDDAGRVVRQHVLGSGAGAGEWRYSYDVGHRRVRIPGRPGSVVLPHVDRTVVSGPGGRRTVSFRSGRSVPDTPSAAPVTAQPAGGGFLDARGRVAARRTPDGGVVRIGYDAFDRPESITDPSGAATRFTYTPAGDLASVTDAAGTTRYAWNEAGQQIGETDPLGGQRRWRYDRVGRLVWSRDARGVVSTFGYDAAGRIAAARYGGSLVRYGYDRAGRLTSVRDSEDGSASLQYDAHGRVAAESSRSGSITATYDAKGNRTRLGLPGGVEVAYEYDSAGRLSGLSLGGSADVHVGSSYDKSGRLNRLDLPNGVRGRFRYDHGLLAEVGYMRDGRAIADQRASYDSAGRVRRLAGDLGRPALPAAQPEARFGAAHQIITDGRSAWRWDRAGNLLQDATHRYTWDARGRLVAVTGAEGRTTFRYDALGRRTSATTDGKTVRYVYDGEDVVQQVAADGTRTTYLRGPDGTPLVSSSGSGDATALLPDSFGNVGATVSADGAVQRFSYDPFGVPSGNKPGGATPGFRGLLPDPTGQLSMGARTYEPTTGRFLSRDSWGIEGGDTDPYRYALGTPTVYTDPSGHAAECVGMALGWAMSVLGPGGGWDDYDALEDKVDSGQISEDEWTVQADHVSHDLWSGFDVVANVCGTSAVGSSAAALPLLGAGKVASRVLGSLADDAVTGAGVTRVGSGFGRQTGVSPVARVVVEHLLEARGAAPHSGLADSGLVDSATIRYSQSSIKGTFGDGRSVKSLLDDLRNGRVKPEEIPAIRLVQRDGHYYTLDNRRLAAFQEAGVDVPYRMATLDEIVNEDWKFTTRSDGLTVRMRGGNR